MTESAVAGWYADRLDCTGAGGDSRPSLGDRTATLDIDAGETVVCTFENTKHASPDGGEGDRSRPPIRRTSTST